MFINELHVICKDRICIAVMENRYYFFFDSNCNLQKRKIWFNRKNTVSKVLGLISNAATYLLAVR